MRNRDDWRISGVVTSPADRLSSALAGRYRIERELGAGGMATVYLAHDVRHDRKVAIKVLKPELAAVLGAERFVVEIKTTASLQHPHILPLFDSGTADGFLFYVMPYIQGETIREKLNRETQFGVDEAVRIAREVADALDYAHRHGVIHRDIKPENILLHDGRAMVMDFGIALAVSAAAGGRMTETGLSLGTPHYMSPEQATAEKEITARSDQYSLASVLYEMLAGQPPHVGGAAQQVIMRIITEPARPVSDFRKNVPPNVVAALGKGLEKLPADRFASAKEFAEALGNAGFSTTQVGVLTATAVQRSRNVPAIVLGTVATLMTAAVGWLVTRSPTSPDNQVLRMQLALPSRTLMPSTALGQNIIAISPQGERIAYVAQDSGGVYTAVRRFDELTGRRVFGGAANDAVFSPDGRWIAFSFQSDVRKVPVEGGQDVRLTTDVGLTVRGLAWLPTDTIVVGSLSGGLRALPAGGGTMRLIAGTDSTIQATFPVVFPDGKTLGFVSGNVGARRLAILAAGQRRFSELGVGALAPVGFRDGHLIYVSATGTLVALPLDLKTQQRLGDGVQLESGIRQTTGGSAYAALSRTGTLLYVTGDTRGRLMLSAGESKPIPLLDDVRDYRYPRFSPDGRRVAVAVFSDATSDIWVYDRVDRTLQKLTTAGDASVPEWSPDGKKLLFRRTRDGRNEIWWQPADGSGVAEALYQGEPVNEALISPDARWLILRTAPQSKFLRDILVRPMVGDTTPRLLVGSPSQESHPRVSPDGRWLAFQSNDAGSFQVYVRPFPNEGGRTQVSTAGGSEPLWSHAGDQIFYRTAEGIEAVSVSTTPSFALRERRAAFAGVSESDLTHQNYDVSPDGRLLMIQSAGGEAQLVLVYNWGRELREKLGAGRK